jgi:hypothetical protein
MSACGGRSHHSTAVEQLKSHIPRTICAKPRVGAGCVQRPAANLNGRAAEDAPRRVGTDAREQHDPDQHRPARMQMQHGRGMSGFERERQAAERRKADADGQAAEALDRCDIDRRQTGGGIHAKAHGAAGKGGKPQIVPKGVRNERRHEHARIGDGLADITQTQEVVKAEQPIARRRKTEGDDDMQARRLAQLLENLAGVQVRKLAPQNERNDRKYEERGEWSDPAQARTVGLLELIARYWRASGRYLTRCGCAASSPFLRLKSSTYS